MKTYTAILLCVLAIIVVIVGYTEAEQSLCDQNYCAADCFDEGLHGQCDSDDICRCYDCIYRACRKHCISKGRVGQCDETACLCL